MEAENIVKCTDGPGEQSCNTTCQTAGVCIRTFVYLFTMYLRRHYIGIKQDILACVQKKVFEMQISENTYTFLWPILHLEMVLTAQLCSRLSGGQQQQMLSPRNKDVHSRWKIQIGENVLYNVWILSWLKSCKTTQRFVFLQCSPCREEPSDMQRRRVHCFS